MWYRAGADLVVVVHLLVIGFIVGGVFLTWRWPLIIWAHIPAVIYGALVEFAGFTCPLTLLENDLRQRAGEAGYRDGFIAHYLVKVIYPPGLTHGMQIGLGILLLLVAIIGYWGFLRRRGRGGGEAGRRLALGTWRLAPSVSCTAPKVTQPIEGSACGRRNLVRALPGGYLHEFASLGEDSAPVSANDGTDATSTVAGFTQGRRLQRGMRSG
jgi:hypothetical protein